MKRNQRQSYVHRAALDAALALLSDVAAEPEILRTGAVRVGLLEASLSLATLQKIQAEGVALGPGYLDIYFDKNNEHLKEHGIESAKRSSGRKRGQIEVPKAPDFVPLGQKQVLSVAQASLIKNLECPESTRADPSIDPAGCVHVSMRVCRALRGELEAIQGELQPFGARVRWAAEPDGVVVTVDLAN